jgi:WD40 repeat protein
VAFSPDGRRVLTGSSDHIAKLWEAETAKELRSLVGHSYAIWSVAFSADGRRVLTGSADQTAKLWDAETGKELRSLAGHSDDVYSVAFSPDGRRVLTGSWDHTAKLWDAETGKELRSFAGHSSSVDSVAFSPDGRRVLTGSSDYTAKLWDAETGKELRSFAGHSSSVDSVAFSPDGRRVLTGSSDHTAKLWDAETGRELRSLTGHAYAVLSVAFSRDGRRVLTGSSDHTAKLWDVATGKELRTFTGHSDLVLGVALSPDGRRVLTGSQDNTAKLWDAETGKELRTLTGHSSPVESVAFSPDGRRILAGSGDKTAKLWDAETGTELRTFRGHSGGVTSVAFSPDGRRILTGSWDHTAKLWDVETGKELRSLKGPETRHIDEGVIAVFSPDGRRVLTGGDDNAVKLWDAETGTELRSFMGVGTGFAFSPDGRRVLTAASDETARLWDAETGTELRTFKGHSDRVASVTFSQDGRYVLTGSWDHTAKLWDVETGKELRSFTGHSYAVLSVAFLPDGRRVLTESHDSAAKLWDADTGVELRSFVGHSGEVTSVAFSPDGRRVLTGTSDNTAKLWDADTGNCVATLVSFDDRSWAVVDPAGRFDGSNDGKVEGLHWVVGNTPIALSQLSERYYEPGLLAKAMGFNKEALRAVEGFEAPKLFPKVELAPLAPGATRLMIRLKNQGGGIGKVQVLVNGVEIEADARRPGTDPNAATAELHVKLAGRPPVKPGQENQVEVIASNAEGYLSSPRGIGLSWRAPGTKEIEPPQIFAIVGGTSHYGLRSMNLTFPGKDAFDIATALRVSADRLFGAKKVHLTLLTDYPKAQAAQPPSRDHLRDAFEAVAREAKHDDVLVVYLSGHGTTAPDGEYWYLTREARSTDLSDPVVRAQSGVSSAELTEWIKAVHVTKQVMILDTCAAGAAAARLTEPRALSSDQVRAIARLKDRTGLYVLMGSAADAASYEASQYGQGLLTYALLEGMRGAALRDDEYVDVARLFAHATDEVPRLAGSIRRIQRPIIAVPGGASFDIGQLTSEDKPLVPLAMVRPMILRAIFQHEERPYIDGLDLSKHVNKALRDATDPTAGGGRIVFADGDELPGALLLTGRYREVGTDVRVDASLFDGKTERSHFVVQGLASDLDGLARALVKQAEEAAAHSP